jgi:hypothetical protein
MLLRSGRAQQFARRSTLAFEDEHEDDHRIGPGDYDMIAQVYIDTFLTARRF